MNQFLVSLALPILLCLGAGAEPNPKPKPSGDALETQPIDIMAVPATVHEEAKAASPPRPVEDMRREYQGEAKPASGGPEEYTPSDEALYVCTRT